jgi:hypothetical protein
MANRKEFTLIGIGSDVQYGKTGGRMRWITDRFEPRLADGITAAQIRVPLVPVNVQDATSKQYVDNLFQGLDAKASVRIATTTNIAVLTGLAAIDGVTPVANDRILVKNQTTTSQNGIYVAAAGAWARATDADATGDITGGSFVFVEEGATQGDTGWVVNSNGTPTIGTDPILWTQFSSAGVPTAGIGLSQAGLVFNVNIGASTISVNGTDNMIVNSSAVASQVLLSAGTIGTEATWGALPLATLAATTGLLPKSRGGLNTDITAFANGSLIVADNTGGDVNELAIGATGNTLRVVAGLPVWGQLDLANNTGSVTGTLAATNGGTGIATYVQGDLIVGAATVNTLTKIAIGTTGQVLQSNGTTATWVTLPSTSGDVVTISADIAFGGGATQLIGTIPAGGRVIKVSIDVTTAFDAAATFVVGDSGLTSRLMIAAANDPQEIMLFSTDLNNLYGSATVVNATMTGAPTVGAGRVIVQFITA